MNFTQYIKENKKEMIVFGAVAFIFLALRLPGIHLPYHQDEWKNVHASENITMAGAFFAHPPLMQIIFVAGNFVLGSDNLRLLPLIFAILSVILLYVVVDSRVGKKAAIWSSFLFSICFYNILGSLSPDVDGAILPFFFILSVYAYDKKWFSLLISVLLAGFLIKLSFILVIGVILADYLLEHRKELTIKKIFLMASGVLGFGVSYVGLLYIIKVIYPAFDISIMLGHANQYNAEEGRNWIQIIVQGIKSAYYLSPLLIVPAFFINKDIFRKTRIFFIYIILGLIFYFGLFDFSRAALDKYLMFLILPLSIICGTIMSHIFSSENTVNQNLKKQGILFGIILSFLLFTLNFLPHSIPPLYPKTEWFSKVSHFGWNILNPFNGGSGPLGFYISFLFIAISFITSIILGVVGFFKKEWRVSLAIPLVIIGLTYNLLFMEELLFGQINGSAPKVLADSVVFIKNSPKIKKVITYNDIGSYELSKTGKYEGRIYATPESEEGYRKKFEEYVKEKGNYFLVVDIPRINPESFYGKFFASCKVEFESVSGKIEAKVYSCGKI